LTGTSWLTAYSLSRKVHKGMVIIPTVVVGMLDQMSERRTATNIRSLKRAFESHGSSHKQ